MRFDKLRENFPKEMQLNAGIFLATFNPASPEAVEPSAILGVTSGGVNFAATPTYKDMGEGLDNCPKNMKELKKLVSYDVSISGTYKTVTPNLVKSLVGAADVLADKVTPRADLKAEDFTDLWWVGDYSDDNTDENGGFVAIHLKNSLSTGGFQIQSTDDDLGSSAFTIMAHYSITNPADVPFEIYVHTGGAA